MLGFRCLLLCRYGAVFSVEVPAGARTRFHYGTLDFFQTTIEDADVAAARHAEKAAAAFLHEPEKYKLWRHNCLYLAAAQKRAKEAFRVTRTIYVGGDGVRAIACEILGVFLAVPESLSFSSLFGFCPPPLVLDDCHVDVSKRPLAARIEQALEGQSSSARVSKPTADPLVATYGMITAVQHALESIVKDGIHEFISPVAAEPLKPGERWCMHGGRLHHSSKVPEGMEAIPGLLVVKGRMLKPHVHVVDETWSVLISLTDQESTVFGCFNALPVVYKARAAWFPGPLHRESNTVTAVPKYAGYDELQTKLKWLSGPFLTGPHSRKDGAGKWKTMRMRAWQEIKDAIRNESSAVRSLLDDALPDMAAALSMSVDDGGLIDCVIKEIEKVATSNPGGASDIRWMSSIDASLRLQRACPFLSFLNDCAIVLNNASPYGVELDHTQTLAGTFDIFEHSLQVGAHLLRDVHFWHIERIRCGI